MSGIIAAGLALLARLASGPTVHCVAGQPCRDQCIFFANHTSHLDVVVLWAVLPGPLRAHTRPIAARDYWEVSPLRRYLATRVFRAILVDREPGKLARLRDEMEQLVAALDAGDSLILFPEGTRGAGAEIGAFKGGLDYLARQRPEIDLVPVHLHNLDRIMPRGEFAPVPQLSRVTFGAPLHRWDGEAKEAFLARAREAVVSLRPA